MPRWRLEVATKNFGCSSTLAQFSVSFMKNYVQEKYRQIYRFSDLCDSQFTLESISKCCVLCFYADMRRRSHNTPTIDGVWCACASELFLDRLSRKFEVLKDSSQFVKLTRFSYRFKLKNVHEKSRNSNKREFSSWTRKLSRAVYYRFVLEKSIID